MVVTDLISFNVITFWICGVPSKADKKLKQHMKLNTELSLFVISLSS
jgi:hypothetical protein